MPNLDYVHRKKRLTLKNDRPDNIAKKNPTTYVVGFILLGYPDSNQERQDQNLQCYHYTIPQFVCINVVLSFLRLQRYNFFANRQNFSRLFYKNSQKKT